METGADRVARDRSHGGVRAGQTGRRMTSFTTPAIGGDAVEMDAGLAHHLFHALFFFSSRRRHTRSYGDWSSDVCSSDLSRTGRGPLTRPRARQPAAAPRPEGDRRSSRAARVGTPNRTGRGEHPRYHPAVDRSEERRVGKEWRGGGGPEE